MSHRLPLAFTWRSIEPTDFAQLQQFDLECKAIEGDEPISRLPEDALNAANLSADNTLCAVLAGKIVALGWVIPDLPANKIRIGGRVHPEFCENGWGEALLSWAETRSIDLAGQNSEVEFVIRNESYTESAGKLYSLHGFQCVFIENMLVRDLTLPIRVHSFPKSAITLPWDQNTRDLFFNTYISAFSTRPYLPPTTAQTWIEDYEDNPDFYPEQSMLALFEGQPAGFITCLKIKNYAWVGQMGVVPEFRGKGIGKALLSSALRQFNQMGFTEAGIHVNKNNQNAASLYESVGFVHRLQRSQHIRSRRTQSWGIISSEDRTKIELF